MEILFLIFGAIVGLVVGFVFGARAGWNRREQVARDFVMKYMQQLHEDAKTNTVNIEITTVDGQFLVHDKDTGEFLAQGTNHTDISKTLKDRFPTKTFLASPTNLKEIGYELNDTV